MIGRLSLHLFSVTLKIGSVAFYDDFSNGFLSSMPAVQLSVSVGRIVQSILATNLFYILISASGVQDICFASETGFYYIT